MNDLLLQSYYVALPIILTALMGYIVWLLKKQKRDRDANSKGTMLLLRVQLIEYHDKYMRLGEIPSYAYENFNEMYDAYHKLGGNGMVTNSLCTAGSDPFYLDQRMECYPYCDLERIIQRSGIHRTASAVQTVYRKERR